MSTIIVTGGTSGLGAEISGHLRLFGHEVHHYDLLKGLDVRRPNVDWFLARVPTRLDVLINCAGINRIGWLEDFDPEDWDAVMDTNAKGIFMMTRALLPQLIAARGTVLNIVSNASHMPMTCSAAYNASKGAAHILTQQLARELTKKYGITVFGISPNKLAGTEMSREIEMQVVETRGWTEEEARRYQLNALLTGEETPPERVAEFIAFLLQSKEHHKYLSGCILPYGA
jgi:3-oxoacyl-[acyl-carrier protein] reductase